MTADVRRGDGSLATFEVRVVFDIDASQRRFDHVATPALCTCGDELRLSASSATLGEHEGGHGAALDVEQTPAVGEAEGQLRLGLHTTRPSGL